jgi:hypothetical protein
MLNTIQYCVTGMDIILFYCQINQFAFETHDNGTITVTAPSRFFNAVMHRTSRGRLGGATAFVFPTHSDRNSNVHVVTRRMCVAGIHGYDHDCWSRA